MLCAMLACCLQLGAAAGRAEAPAAPEARAVAFLCREVPRWPRDNHCFSCHNNGDAARALYLAADAGYAVPETVLAETTRWLQQPAKWDQNGGDGPFSDKRLARVAFAAALATAAATGKITDRRAVRESANRLAREQAPDGSWTPDGEDSISSPAAYGRALATLLARESLQTAGPDAFRDPVRRAETWLLRRDIVTITDAAVCLLAFGNDETHTTARLRATSLDLLARGQNHDGGWGPQLTSPAEVYDTALALLGLSKCKRSAGVRRMMTRGRVFLVAQQQDDGGWVETTRPSGGLSYAQRISTSGWATLALLATRDLSARPEDAKR
jgi:Squalene-hopene cyclase C-terminal domain